MYELEAVLRIIEHVVLEVLVGVNRIYRVEHKLLSGLRLLRNEAVRRAMQEVPADLGWVHELASAQQGVVWIALLGLEHHCSVGWNALVLRWRANGVARDVQVVYRMPCWVTLLPSLILLYLFHHCTLPSPA